MLGVGLWVLFLFGFFYVLSVFKLCYRILMFGTVFSFLFYRSRCVAGFFYFVAVKDFILLLPFLLFTVFLLSASPFSFVCHELFYITSSAFVALFFRLFH